jgi:hypothetical protein
MRLRPGTRSLDIIAAMRLRWIAALLALTGVASAQKYTGPRPSKPDLPYLKHAETLVPTEATEAKEEKGKKDDITYVIAGASSSAKTPLASPILLMESQKLSADKLELYKLEVKNGHREITVSPKKPGRAIRVTVTKLSSDGLYKLEVEESLEAGEYSLTPAGENRVFCFQVF